MANVLIRNLDEKLVKKLKERAARNGRSVQAELKLIIEEGMAVDMIDFAKVAAEIREKFRGRTFSDSAESIAEDRRR